MSIYVIGDIQGCFQALQKLLEKIHFDPSKDNLWFTGDLVNRGPESLATIRFVKSLKDRAICVLGNHDLHLLAVAFGAHKGTQEDTFHDILSAPDRDELLIWLRHLPLIHHDVQKQFTMVHAGLAPQWDLHKALTLAKEAETLLHGNQPAEFFAHMYANHPVQWSDNLVGWDRIRCIINYCTRMRFCHPDGRMELDYKGNIDTHPEDLIPWFQVKHRKTTVNKIIFGHWAALNGITHTPNTYALDTGCVWGNCLTAMRLEDEHYISVPCSP
ncbi:diadenosine tetraphosphatase [Gammaproteobacteria bacterium SCGC AG-212-F23]|nr:diadenosine tetraphosphatase [Gammaproteobacteria bacterium SCGC AG-212-F23]